MEIFFGVVLAALLWLNAAASYHLARSQIYGRQQKFWQLLIVWLVPFLGAVVVLTIMAGSGTRPDPQTAPTGIFGTMFYMVTLSGVVTPHSGEHNSTDGGPSGFNDMGSGDGGQ